MTLEPDARQAERAVREAIRRQRQAEERTTVQTKHTLLDGAREHLRRGKAVRERSVKAAARAASATRGLRIAAMLALAVTIVLALAGIRRQLFPNHDIETTGFVHLEDFRRAEAFLSRAMEDKLHAERVLAADLAPEQIQALTEILARMHGGILLGVTVGNCDCDSGMTTLSATAMANGTRFVIQLIPRKGQFRITDIAEEAP